MDSRVVPGVLLSNRKIASEQAELRDLTVTILDAFGVETPAEMQGHSVF